MSCRCKFNQILCAIKLLYKKSLVTHYKEYQLQGITNKNTKATAAVILGIEYILTFFGDLRKLSYLCGVNADGILAGGNCIDIIVKNSLLSMIVLNGHQSKHN